MPPTAFHPTHSTPFKSSISSSQQARRREEGKTTTVAGDTAPASTQWPEVLSASALDSRQWTYLAEGGKNLVLRYEGPQEPPFVHASGTRIALRLSKVSRPIPESNNVEEEISALEWRDSVLQPDLAGVGILPPLLRLQDDSPDHAQTRSFLREMAAKIEPMRSMERRRVSGLDETAKEGVFVTEDLSASMAARQTISFEIKPKCGFLPGPTVPLSDQTAEVKRKHSRYRMHRVLKQSSSPPTLADFEQWYDPVDLYSGEQGRISKAAGALYNDWARGEGNLRVFANGRRFEAAEALQLDTLARDHFESKSIEDLFASLLAGQDMQDVLQRLKHLQAKYDHMDVEGVAALYHTQTGKRMAEADEPPVSLAEFQAAVRSGEGRKSAREAVVKLLLSAMYKDCSLFLRCISGSTQQHSLYLVDLDPKPVSKLGYFEQLDRDVTTAFRDWAGQVGI